MDDIAIKSFNLNNLPSSMKSKQQADVSCYEYHGYQETSAYLLSKGQRTHTPGYR